MPTIEIIAKRLKSRRGIKEESLITNPFTFVLADTATFSM